jgi:hypothetical protein
MKKLAILFLLATVLVSFTFAQVTVKGGLDLNNVGEANDTTSNVNKRDIQLYTEFVGTAKTDLGPGAIGAELSLGTALSFQDKNTTTSAYKEHGDIYLKGFYELPAGPGTLGIALSLWSPSFGGLHFNVGYTGLAAGPVVLGFDVEYDFNTLGQNDKTPKEAAAFGEGGSKEGVPDDIILKVTADFAFGLSITYKFDYAIADTTATANGATGNVKGYIKEIAYLDIAYALPSIPLKVGVELSGTGGFARDGTNVDTKQAFFGSGYAGINATGGAADPGLNIKPYAEYAITEKVKAGAFVAVKKLGTDKEKNGTTDSNGAAKAWDIELNPGLWISYSF